MTCISKSTYFIVFFPRTWGLSYGVLGVVLALMLFPTHMGVILCPYLSMVRSITFSHAHGGYPDIMKRERLITAFFPRTWGLSQNQDIPAAAIRIFPTHTGGYPFPVIGSKPSFNFFLLSWSYPYYRTCTINT